MKQKVCAMNGQFPIGPTPTPTMWEPLRVALAWLVTSGDTKFVQWVRDDRKFNAPCVLAGCLATEMLETRCVLATPSYNLGPRFAIVSTPYSGRLQLLVEHFERRWLPGLSEPPTSEIPPEWLPSHDMRRTKIFKFTDLISYLEKRIDNGWAEIRKCIANGEIRARGAAVDSGIEGPAGDVPPSAVTETMTVGLNDGLLHQGPACTRVWKSVTLSWMDLIEHFTESAKGNAGAPEYARRTTQIEAIRMAFQVVFNGQVPLGMAVKERDARIAEYIVANGGRRPSTRTFQRALAHQR